MNKTQRRNDECKHHHAVLQLPTILRIAKTDRPPKTVTVIQMKPMTMGFAVRDAESGDVLAGAHIPLYGSFTLSSFSKASLARIAAIDVLFRHASAHQRENHTSNGPAGDGQAL